MPRSLPHFRRKAGARVPSAVKSAPQARSQRPVARTGPKVRYASRRTAKRGQSCHRSRASVQGGCASGGKRRSKPRDLRCRRLVLSETAGPQRGNVFCAENRSARPHSPRGFEFHRCPQPRWMRTCRMRGELRLAQERQDGFRPIHCWPPAKHCQNKTGIPKILSLRALGRPRQRPVDELTLIGVAC